MEDLNVFELGRIIQRELTLSIRINQKLSVQLLSSLFYSVETFDDNCRKLLQINAEPLLLLYHPEDIEIAPRSP